MGRLRPAQNSTYKEMRTLIRIAEALERIATVMECDKKENKISKFDAYRRRWTKGEDKLLLAGMKRGERVANIVKEINATYHNGRTVQAAHSRHHQIMK